MNGFFLSLIAFVATSVTGDEVKLPTAPANPVIHVATALDHLTVLEFGEPVMMAAAGSADFQIERHDNKVFVKPLKQGAATDLFVWTASRRFAYELEAPGEVKDMNFALDHRDPAPKSIPDTRPTLEELADTVLTRALLGAERIDSSYIKDTKKRVTVRIEQVFRSPSTTYIHYSIKNSTDRPYQLLEPVVCQAESDQPTISLVAFHHVQLTDPLERKLGSVKLRRLTIAKAKTEKENLEPGEETQGVVVVREQLASPQIVQLIFGESGSEVRATVVF